MIAVVDYGVGNLFSLTSSLRFIGAKAEVTSDPAVIARADGVILPGVGAFADARAKLRSSGAERAVLDAATACTRGWVSSPAKSCPSACRGR